MTCLPDCPADHGEPPPDTSWVTFESVSDGNGPLAVVLFALMLAMVIIIVILELS